MDKGRERKLSAKEIAGFALIAFAIASMIFSVLGSWYFYNWQKPYSVTPPSYPEHMVPVPPMGPTPTPALSSQDHSKPLSDNSGFFFLSLFLLIIGICLLLLPHGRSLARS